MAATAPRSGCAAVSTKSLTFTNWGRKQLVVGIVEQGAQLHRAGGGVNHRVHRDKVPLVIL